MSVSGISRASQHSGPGILPDKYSYYLQSMRSSHGDLGRVGVLGGAPLVGGSAGGGQLRYASPLWPGQGEPQDRLASQKPAADAKLSPSKVGCTKTSVNARAFEAPLALCEQRVRIH